MAKYAASMTDDRPSKEEFEALQATVMAQEHRLLSIIGNLIKHGRGGRFQGSAWMALLSRIFSPATIVIGTGGVVALLTYLELREQTGAVVDQNEFFAQQLQQDSEADFEARKAQLLAIIYDTEQRWPWSQEVPRASTRARAEAVLSYHALVAKRTPNARVRLTDAILADADLSHANLTDADLDEANLNGADLNEAILAGAGLFDADLSYANLIGADLNGANLTDADLTEAILAVAYLRGAYLTRATLNDATLTGADLSDATLSCAILNGADLNGANLTGANLTGATYNTETRWPIGFEPVKAGARLR
ncbi:MAG: pentapeptide repeat-containing protein [Planctomycetota bacterium]